MAIAALSRPGVPINLLPEEIRSRLRLRRIFVGLGIGAGTLVVVLAGVTVLQRVAINNAEEDLRLQKAEAARLQGEVAALQRFDLLQKNIVLRRTTLATALQGDVSWPSFLADLAVTIPNDSSLTSLSMAAAAGTTPAGEPSFGTVQYSGVVLSFPGLSGWLVRMDDLEGLKFVYLGSGSRPTDPGTVTFSATANLTETMLSRRCQGPAEPCP